MRTKVISTTLLFLLLLSSCKIEEIGRNEEDVNCGIAENECNLCADFDPESPQFIIAVVGDGVEDNKVAMDRKYSINRAQGEAMWKGVQLAYQHSHFVNDANVKKIITIKSFDDGGAGECAKKIAECLYKNPCVLAVIGHATSGTTQEAARFYNKGRIPLMMPIATSPNVFYPATERTADNRYDNVFRLPPSDDEVQAYALGLVAIDRLKANKIALLGDISIDAPTYSKPIYQKLNEEILGKRKGYHDEVIRTNAASVASNIKQTQPDLIIFAGYWTNFQLILGPLRDLYEKERQKPRILLSDGCMSKDLDPYGFEVYVTFPAPDVLDNTLTQTEGLEHLRNLIKQQGHQSYEIFGYDALQLIAQAILESRKDGISRVSLINTLASKPEFSGAGFNYRFENGENIKSNYYLYNVTSKSFQLLNADEIRKFKSEIKVRQ